MGAKVRRGLQFRGLLKSEMERVITEACLSCDDEVIARGYYVSHNAMEDIAADTLFCRATISRRLTRIIRRMDAAARKLGLLP